MSMYEIEGLVEWSIRSVDEAGISVEEKRDLIYSLYKFQSLFDTGYTAFRVEDILYKYHYLIRLPIELYPDKDAVRLEVEEAARKNESSFWLDDSIVMTDQKDGTQKMYFYNEAGSGGWQKLVDANLINGDDAKPVKEVPVLDMINIVLEIAKSQNDYGLASEWFGVMFYIVTPDLGYCELSDEDFPKLEEIRNNLFFTEDIYPIIGNVYLISRGLDYIKEDTSENVQFMLEPYLNWLDNNK